jgi:lipid-A-disaccharide synthase-like uncharacterized protein
MREWLANGHAWLVLGLTGQIAFGSRFLWQWVVSERAREVVIPRGFWILSLMGGAALLVYAWHRHDPVFMLGQAAGLLIYARNLRFTEPSRTR